jgi:hypothetical protein
MIRLFKLIFNFFDLYSIYSLNLGFLKKYFGVI